MHGQNDLLDATFICDDCKKIMLIAERCDADLDVCKPCADMYPNETGYCSYWCRVTGRCDDAC